MVNGDLLAKLNGDKAHNYYKTRVQWQALLFDDLKANSVCGLGFIFQVEINGNGNLEVTNMEDS